MNKIFSCLDHRALYLSDTGASSSPEHAEILTSTLAGSWFESNPVNLSRQLESFVSNVQTEPEEEAPCAILMPHAGYIYSGQTAAYAVRKIAGKKYSRVVILGPSHRVYMKNTLAIAEAAAMRSPLGTVQIDRKANDILKKYPFVQASDRIHHGEHSVQIQLPLLQFALENDFRVVPVVVGQLDGDFDKKAAEAIRSVLDDNTLLVISSDFTHFGENFNYTPYLENIEENLRNLDLGAFELIRKKDRDGFADYITETGATICGEAAIRMLLDILPQDSSVSLLHYTTSSAESKDFSHCVSYLSASFQGRWSHSPSVIPEEKKEKTEDFLTDEDKKILLSMARRAIGYVFENFCAPYHNIFKSDATPRMMKKAGCFVTLTIDGELRGCIGEIEPSRELYKAVTGRAVDAAFRDPRFHQLTPEEFKKIQIEISVLTPAVPVASWKDIVIGKHGMTIEKNGRSAVFLPQVAGEQGWDLPETLTYLSRKAGLPPDSWQDSDARFTVFEAIVFNESQFQK